MPERLDVQHMSGRHCIREACHDCIRRPARPEVFSRYDTDTRLSINVFQNWLIQRPRLEPRAILRAELDFDYRHEVLARNYDVWLAVAVACGILILIPLAVER